MTITSTIIGIALVVVSASSVNADAVADCIEICKRTMHVGPQGYEQSLKNCSIVNSCDQYAGRRKGLSPARKATIIKQYNDLHGSPGR